MPPLFRRTALIYLHPDYSAGVASGLAVTVGDGATVFSAFFDAGLADTLAEASAVGEGDVLCIRLLTALRDVATERSTATTPPCTIMNTDAIMATVDTTIAPSKTFVSLDMGLIHLLFFEYILFSTNE
jgi:hypothetical protein